MASDAFSVVYFVLNGEMILDPQKWVHRDLSLFGILAHQINYKSWDNTNKSLHVKADEAEVGILP